MSTELGGPRILIKRDDMAGGPLGGNKTRMLEFVLAKAIGSGADTVVGGSAAQSNYSRQLAAGCARLGLECHLVLRDARGERLGDPQGSLLLDLLYGATVTLIEDDRALQTQKLQGLSRDLTEQGRNVYEAPQASEEDKPLHAAAYSSAIPELLDQLEERSVEPAAIYVSSLDTTHAGLLLGLRACGTAVPLLAISPNERSIFPDRTIEQEVARLANTAAELVRTPLALTAANVQVSTDYVGSTYGVMTDAGLAAMIRFARSEAILLDPVYSAKAAAAMIDDIEMGRYGPDDTIIFWHTGGMPAVFAYAPEIASGLASKAG